MFWKKKPKDQPLAPHRTELNQMAATVLGASGINFDAESQLNQALVGTYIFGMIYAHGMSHKLAPPEVHALAICVFQDTLHYSAPAAAQGVQECIDATEPGHHDTMNTILHHGIDGHAAYISTDVASTAASLCSILAHFEK